MKKRVCTLLLALVMLASIIMGALPAMAAPSDVTEDKPITLRIHYSRDDGNYEGWHLWLWDNSKVTPLKPPYTFTQEGNEMVATVGLNAGTMEVGYIVHRVVGNDLWVEKDVPEDQFIEIAGIVGGTVDVYIKSGVKGHEIVLHDDLVRDTVIVYASYVEENRDGLPQVIAKMSNVIEDYEVTNETFKISNRDYTATITAVKVVNSFYYLTLSEKLDPMRGYLLNFEDEKAEVRMPDIYSTKEFEERYTYTGNDLGFTYTPEKTMIRFWAPLALKVTVNLYHNGDPAKEPTPFSKVEMKQDVKGTWLCELPGDMNETYYTFEATYDTKVVEACDPFARTTGVNGLRAEIFDMDATDPEGWENDRNPNAGLNYTDAIIYEASLRDLTADPSSGVENKGKFVSMIETGTVNSFGQPTVLDYIVRLGVNYIQLMPVYDFGSVDESKPEEERGYNWGYDPVTYNVPDGSYATNPYDGTVRVKEFKQMVKGLHDNGLSVVMDVVYNHVYDAGKFSFNQLVPGYYIRPDSNGSGCGNDVASERSMVSKYIVDSVNYWVDEYHIDGFRFDLMGVLDTKTMNEIVRTVHEKHPDVIFYGEGWDRDTKMTKPGYDQATQFNSKKIPSIGSFNDTFRNLIKGNTYGGVSAGWISGASVSKADLDACFKGMPFWCPTPSQAVNYNSCHDNNTFYDHITMVLKNASEDERMAVNKLGAAFCFSAAGIPFFQAGEEILRTKPNGAGFHDNSYSAGDEVNSLKWDTLSNPKYLDMYEYYRGLILFRKTHPALRLSDAASVEAAINPISGLPDGVVAYNITGGQEGEPADAIICAFNASKSDTTITLPEGEWKICVNGEKAGIDTLGTATGTVTVSGQSAVFLVQGEEVIEPNPPIEWWKIMTLIAACVVVAAVAMALILKKKK